MAHTVSGMLGETLDRLVVGIRSSKVSEALQMDAKLTLEEAKKIRQKKAVQEQIKLLQPNRYRSRPRGAPVAEPRGSKR